VDSTISLPLLTAYCLSRVKPRKLKRLYDRRDEILDKVRSQYLKDRHGHEGSHEPQDRQARQQRRYEQNSRSRPLIEALIPGAKKAHAKRFVIAGVCPKRIRSHHATRLRCRAHACG
jgi:hypothetical protein